MVPERDHEPALRLEPFKCFGIAFDITFDFRGPIGSVGLGHRVVGGTAVPEATVHKDCNLGARKHDIRASIPLFYRAGMDAIAQAQTVQVSSYLHLWGCISTAISDHGTTDPCTRSP